MGSLFHFFFIFLSPLLALCTTTSAAVPPLSTESRWIVDKSGHRVKLACVNWPSHLEVVVAEGLSKKPVDQISSEIIGFGFNCVRLTWPLFLFTNDTLASLSVRQSFKNLGLFESIAGFQINNPSIIDLSLVKAYQVTKYMQMKSSYTKFAFVSFSSFHLFVLSFLFGFDFNIYEDNLVNKYHVFPRLVPQKTKEKK